MNDDEKFHGRLAKERKKGEKSVRKATYMVCWRRLRCNSEDEAGSKNKYIYTYAAHIHVYTENIHYKERGKKLPQQTLSTTECELCQKGGNVLITNRRSTF